MGKRQGRATKRVLYRGPPFVELRAARVERIDGLQHIVPRYPVVLLAGGQLTSEALSEEFAREVVGLRAEIPKLLLVLRKQLLLLSVIHTGGDDELAAGDQRLAQVLDKPLASA